MPVFAPLDDPRLRLQHDLRTPLTAIRGHAQLLRRTAARLEGPERERLLAGLTVIDAAATVLTDRVAALADDEPLPLGDPADGARRPA